MTDPADRQATNASSPLAPPAGDSSEVFRVALRIGLSSFGGPIAHLGYFERTYVRERQWLSSEQYAGLLALCQFLPGPTSSQVGFLVGLHRAGWRGALAAWVGFTLPSALLMYAFAQFAPKAPGPWMQALLHGLMLTAVAVVAQALWSMARTLAPDLLRRAIAVAACSALLFLHGTLAQLATLAGGAFAGWILCRSVLEPIPAFPMGLRTAAAWVALSVFVLLLVGLSVVASFNTREPLALANVFYRSGALVFGGGHVVLPLLHQALVPPGWISDQRFLAGYGFAQAMPGPLFSVAAYLGAVSAPPHPSFVWAVLALILIFLPGLLLAVAGLSLVARIANVGATKAILSGLNAAVVGLLAAALYNPVWVNSVHSLADVGTVSIAFLLLQRFKFAPVLVATLCVAASTVSSMVGV